MGYRHKYQFVNLEQRRDRDKAHTYNERASFVQSEQTGQHHARHNSHDEEVYNLKRKVDQFHRRLHRKARIRAERTPTWRHGSSFEDDRSYRWRSRTPPIESFTYSSCNTSSEGHHCKRSTTPPRRSQGNDAMGKALLQISRSPFSKRVLSRTSSLVTLINQLSQYIMARQILLNT